MKMGGEEYVDTLPGALVCHSDRLAVYAQSARGHLPSSQHHVRSISGS